MTSLLGTWTQVRNRAPVSYAPRSASFLPGILTRTGSAVQLGAMASSGTVFTIVSRIAEATASTSWVIETLPTEGKPDPTPIPKHPALDLVHKPNAFMSGRDLFESVQQHIDLTGEGYFIIYRGSRTGLPVELWPARPDRMTPVPGKDGVFLAGWIYTGPDGERVPLDVQDVIQVKLPDPVDPYRGLGPLQSVLVDIDSARMAAEWNRNFFLNSAQPGGIIEVDEALSEAEWRQMVARWREQHQGVAQSHRVAILEKGKWVDRNYTLKDMQFAELRGIPREVVREAFGYPKAMLGAVDDVNRANAEAGEYVFSRWVLVPRLARLQSALNARLLPMYGPLGEGIQFTFESPVPEDQDAENLALQTKVNAYIALIGAHVTPESASEITGLPLMEHEEPEPVPAALDPKVPDGTPIPGGGSREADQQDAEEEQGVEDPAKAKGGKVAPKARLRNEAVPRTLPADAQPDITPTQEAWDAALVALLAEWGVVSAVQQAALISQIHRIVAAGDITGLQSLNVRYEDGTARLTTAMVELGDTSSQLVVDEAQAQDVELEPAPVNRTHLAAIAGIAAAVLAHQLALAACMAATRAWGATSTPEDVAAAVRTHLAELTDAQPRQVLGGALTAAQHEARMATISTGPFAALYASEANDANTCISCREIDNTWLGNSNDPVQPWLAAYPSRGYVGCLGGDRCRGTVVAIWRDGSAWPALISGGHA